MDRRRRTASAAPSTVTGGPLTLAELSRRPCRALDDEDLRSTELPIFTDPVVDPPGPDGPTPATDFAKAILAHLR